MIPIGGSMNFNRIAALVPLRHHSQRVPGKNYKLLVGKPLFHHILETLSKCDEINEIVEKVRRVVRTWRGLRVILNGKCGELLTPDPSEGIVV